LEEQKHSFEEALDFVLHHLKRLLERYRYTQSCRKVVEEAMSRQKECLVFEAGIPWQELFFDLGGAAHPAKFVIMPSGEHWTLRGIPPNNEDRMSVRIPLPLEWAGLLEKDLQDVSGIAGAIFCHKGRFISVWETREDALKALELTMNKERSMHDHNFR